MNFSDITTDQVVQGFGLPAAIVIVALAGALIFTVRLLLKSYDKIVAIQEQRVLDAREFSNKLSEPLESIRMMSEQQGRLSEKTYEILLDGKRRN